MDVQCTVDNQNTRPGLYNAIDRFFHAFVISQNQRTVQIRNDSVISYMRKVSLDETLPHPGEII